MLACPPAFAGAPTDRLREFFARVNVILADPTTDDRPLERLARARRLVADVADMSGAAATALGPEWETRSAAEREEFVTLFGEVLERAYVGRLAGAVRAAGGIVTSYGDEVVSGDEARVRTALRGLGGHDLRVEYRMTLRGPRWRVRDIEVDGVSTVENYGAQFKRLLRHGSYLGLVDQLRAKLGEETLMFARSERRTPAIVSMPPADREVAEVAPPNDTPPIAVPMPSVRERAPVVERVASRPPRTELVTRSSAPVVIAAVRATGPSSAPAPPSPRIVSPAPVSAAAVTINEPSALSSLLGAVLLGVAGAGGAAVFRRRPAQKA